MNIYKSVEYIKNLFKKTDVPVDNPFEKEDIILLSSMCDEARYVVATNGVEYFYYTPVDESKMNVLMFVMKRNGLKPKVHNTNYYIRPRKILRVPYNGIKNNDRYIKFTDAVINNYMRKDKDVDLLLRKVEEQMSQRSK